MNTKHIGSSLDDLLTEDGLLEEVTARAMKRAIARQIDAIMRVRNLTKTALAHKMKTSRSALDRLLDSHDTSLTLTTLAAAAVALRHSVALSFLKPEVGTGSTVVPAEFDTSDQVSDPSVSWSAHTQCQA
jgi:DNA-binding Xre family transcriptional regulator